MSIFISIKDRLRLKLIEFQRQLVTLTEGKVSRERASQVNEEKLLIELLDIADALENLSKHSTTQAPSIGKSCDKVLKKLLRLLAKYQVEPIVFSDNIAIPRFAKIVQTEQKDGVLPGTILCTIRQGYQRGERVLRVAEVITCRG